MSIVHSLLEDVSLPKMALVRQIFPDVSIEDVNRVVVDAFSKPEIRDTIVSNARIAIAVGSRGLNQLPELVKAIVDQVRLFGAVPFIVPSMGSHGGANAEEQTALLGALGVTEETVGCEISSSMETIEIDRLPNGLPIYMDKKAQEADGIIVVNRIKPHTSFSGRYESGLVKMISIGLGNQQGAESCHAFGFGQMGENILHMAEVKLQKSPIILGVATIENAYDKICQVSVLPSKQIIDTEPELLLKAKSLMSSILFNPLDVLIVDQIGKEYSGTGADPNITGKVGTEFVTSPQKVSKMAFLDLSEKSKGNATGVGLAEVVSKRLVEKIDIDATYANPITSTVLLAAKIPMTMDNDKLALQVAVKTSNALNLEKVRLVRVANTMDIGVIQISESLLDEARDNPNIEIVSPATTLSFGVDGNLEDFQQNWQKL